MINTLTLTVQHDKIDTTARTITGTIAVYGQLTSDGRKIKLAPGCLTFPDDPSRVKLLLDHDHGKPVGFCASFDPDTLAAVFRIPAGPDGDIALAHARDGLRDGLSVGLSFPDPDSHTVDDDEVLTIHRAHVIEVSLVALPAFSDARVTNVAASHTTEGTPMATTPPAADTTPHAAPPLTLAAVEKLLDTRLGEQSREFAAAFDRLSTPPAAELPSFESFGHYVKAVAAGDEAALTFHEQAGVLLKYDGAKSEAADPQPKWIADAIKLVERPRRTLQFFDRQPLPPEGLTIEYAKIKANSDTTQVAKQTAEGDDLKKGKIEFDSATETIETYGGWVEFTRQIVDRMPASYLATLYRALMIKYGQATEAAVAAKLNAVTTGGRDAATLTLPQTPTAQAWIDMLVDATLLFERIGHTPEALLVAPDVFKGMAALETTGGDRLMSVQGDNINHVGTVSVKGLSGSIASFPVLLMPQMTAGSAVVADSIGITTWEAPGAPFQLQDENVVNLTKQYSIYGYLAVGSQYPDAVQTIKIGD